MVCRLCKRKWHKTHSRHFSSRLPLSDGTCKYAKAPSTKKTWTDSLPIDMLLSAVSVLAVAQSSSEIQEVLMNNPVDYKMIHGPYSIELQNCVSDCTSVSHLHKSLSIYFDHQSKFVCFTENIKLKILTDCRGQIRIIYSSNKDDRH
jgi:hypothetical protein